MGPLLIWSRAEIRRSWGSLLLVAVLISIAGGAIMAGVAGARRAGTAVERYVAFLDLASVGIFTDEAPSAALRDQLQRDERIEFLSEGRVVAIAPVGVEPLIEGGMLLAPATTPAGARTTRLVEGVLPERAGEVGVDASTAASLHVEVGDLLDLQAVEVAACFEGPCDPVPAGRAELVGILQSDRDLAPEAAADWRLLIASDVDVEAATIDTATTGWITSIWPAPGVDPDDIVATYAPLVGDGNVLNDADPSSGFLSPAYRAADLERNAVLAATVVAAIASLAIVGQAHARFLARRRSDVEALASMGMTRADRAGSALVPGIAASIAGALLSVPVAVVLSPLFPLRTARRADPDVGFHADLAVVIPGVVIFALVTMSTAFASAWAWSRRTPSVRSDEVSIAARLAERWRLRPTRALALRFALEHRAGPERLPARSAIAGCFGAIVVITAALVITASVDQVQREPAIAGVTWDLTAAVGEDPKPAEDFVAADDRIASAAFVVPGELDVIVRDAQQSSVPAIGMRDLKGRFDHTVLSGRAPAGPLEVAFSTDALQRTGTEIGDEITLSGPGGEQDAVVVGRIVFPTGAGDVSNGIVVDQTVMEALDGNELIAEIDAEPYVTLSLTDPTYLDDVRADVEAAGAGTEVPRRPIEVVLLDEVRFVPRYLAVFVAGLGALAAFHALWTTARRRRHDVMVLRALGCRTWDASSVVRWHGVVLALVALALGVPLGVLAGRVIWTSIATERDLVVRVDLPWVALAALAAGTVGAAALVLAMLPAHNAARRSLAGELRSE